MDLFDEKFLYTAKGQELAAAARAALNDVIRPFLTRGASVRDVSHIVSHAMQTIECETILMAHSKGKTIKEYLTEN